MCMKNNNTYFSSVLTLHISTTYSVKEVEDYLCQNKKIVFPFVDYITEHRKKSKYETKDRHKLNVIKVVAPYKVENQMTCASFWPKFTKILHWSLSCHEGTFSFAIEMLYIITIIHNITCFYNVHIVVRLS